MVIQVVRVSIRPEQRGTWLELIRANAAQTRSERGCESYQISEDLEQPDTFLLVERWRISKPSTTTSRPPSSHS
jgi:quinol monooxygenase YgiN